MNQVLQAPPRCEKHDCDKVWINDRSNRNGGIWRCRECNNENSRKRNARNAASPEKKDEINAAARGRYNAQPQEKKTARNQQIAAQRAERFENDPQAKEVARLATNARQNAARASWTPGQKRDYRDNNLRKTYGSGVADYDRMFEEQEGRCAICGGTDSRSSRTEHFFVDHCHETGQVRGLLCAGCNVGIGGLGDNIDRLKAAIEYLENASRLGADARGAA